jgi:Cu(I)/Ag(I) efflux system membrane protein CusA/SilA
VARAHAVRRGRRAHHRRPADARSENARLAGWVYVDIRGRDLRSAVRDMQRAVAEQVKLPPGLLGLLVGQFEFLERATPS